MSDLKIVNYKQIPGILHVLCCQSGLYHRQNNLKKKGRNVYSLFLFVSNGVIGSNKSVQLVEQSYLTAHSS